MSNNEVKNTGSLPTSCRDWRRLARILRICCQEKAQNAQKERKNDKKITKNGPKSALFNRREKKVYQVIR